MWQARQKSDDKKLDIAEDLERAEKREYGILYSYGDGLKRNDMIAKAREA